MCYKKEIYAKKKRKCMLVIYSQEMYKNKYIYIYMQGIKINKIMEIFACHLCSKEVCAKEPYVSEKQPYISAKEPYISAKEPHISAQEPYISSKERLISAKELCISAKEPYISSKEPYISANEWSWKGNIC